MSAKGKEGNSHFYIFGVNPFLYNRKFYYFLLQNWQILKYEELLHSKKIWSNYVNWSWNTPT